ncbi:MAG: DUF4436 family protein [Candidatus Eremiobacteraeota bacterium]|nr:DUF4436 family protein [Candidatus Eremiobacteraeota bacterium]
MRRGTIVGVVAALVILYAAGIFAYFKDTGVGVFDSPENPPADRLGINVTTMSIDVAKQQVDLSILPDPQGNLTDDNGFTSKKNISFTIYTGDSQKTVDIKAGQPITTIDVPISAFGNISAYPFDQYSGWISFDSDTPFAVHWESDLQAFHAHISADTKNGSTPLILDADYSRSSSVRVFALFLYLLTALVATVAVTVTICVVFRGYKLEFGQIGWSAALLFVLPAVRTSLPGGPPLGTLADFLVFFWAEALVVLCLITLVRRWIVTQKPVVETVGDTD